MILSENIKDAISVHNIKYYNSNGYNVKLKDILNISIELISPKSNPYIKAKCEKCDNIVKIKYNSYLKNKNNYYFSCSSKCSSYKAKMTSLERYGVDVPSKLEIVKNKMKNTCLERYGTEWSFQSEIIKDKIKNTCMKKYGVEYISQSKEFKSTIKNTCMKKYGVENVSQSKDVKDKMKQTNIKNHGVEYPLQNKEIYNKYINTMTERYGVDSPLKSKDIYRKYKKTMIERYGVEYVLQNKEILIKQQKSAFTINKYKDTNLHYQASYELDFLNNYYDKVIIENGPTIKYIFENANKIYFPDFYLLEHNLIVEIKSAYIYNLHAKINLAKQKACLEQGYNFIFVIDKNYDKLNKIIK